MRLPARSGDEIQTFKLPLIGELTIGRDEASGLRIDDPSAVRAGFGRAALETRRTGGARLYDDTANPSNPRDSA